MGYETEKIPEIIIHGAHNGNGTTAYAKGRLWKLRPAVDEYEQPLTEIYFLGGPDGDEPFLAHIAARSIDPAPLAVRSMKEALENRDKMIELSNHLINALRTLGLKAP